MGVFGIDLSLQAAAMTGSAGEFAPKVMGQSAESKRHSDHFVRAAINVDDCAMRSHLLDLVKGS